MAHTGIVYIFVNLPQLPYALRTRIKNTLKIQSLSISVLKDDTMHTVHNFQLSLEGIKEPKDKTNYLDWPG